MRIVMMGTGTFAEPAFELLLSRPNLVVGLVTQPDRDVGAKRGSTRQTGKGLKSIAETAGIPVIQPESINTPEGVAALRAMNPDLLVVAAYGQILKPEVLAVAAQGGINVHASLLPKYRGAAPVAWAIWKGEIETGVTIIRMSAGLDAGEILIQESVEIFPNETAGELEARLAPVGAKLALATVQRMMQGPLSGVKQDPNLVTKAPKLKKEMGLIAWSRPAGEVWNQIRAMQPWPTAYTFLHSGGHKPLRLIVNDATPAPFRDAAGPCGSLQSAINEEGDAVLVVSAGEGTFVRILELQPAGKRRMTADEFLRGHPVQPGDLFGPESLSHS